MNTEYFTKFNIFKEKILERPYLKNEGVEDYIKLLQETFEKSCEYGWETEFKDYLKFIKNVKHMQLMRSWTYNPNRSQFFTYVMKEEIYDDEEMNNYFLLHHNLLPTNKNECLGMKRIIEEKYSKCSGVLNSYLSVYSEIINDFVETQVINNKLVLDTFFNDEHFDVPSNVNEVVFGQFFNKKFNLPPWVEKIVVGKNYQKQIIFSNPITHLTLLNYTEEQIIVPNGLKYFESSKLQDINLINNLSSLEILILGDFYENPLPKLENLISLKIGSSFNHPIDGLFPKLEYCFLGMNFNQRLDNLPPSMKILSVGYRDGMRILSTFNQRLDFLPINLQKLYLNKAYDLDLNNIPAGCVVEFR